MKNIGVKTKDTVNENINQPDNISPEQYASDKITETMKTGTETVAVGTEKAVRKGTKKAIEKAVSQTPRYRYSVKSAHKRKYPVKGLAITAMLFAIIGIGAYSKFFPMAQKTSYDKVEVIEINNNDKSTEKESMATEKQEETITSAEQKESADTETVKVIPVEKVPQE